MFMLQWDRDTSGRLHRISTQLDQSSEVSVHTDTMDPLPEEQQSQPGTPMNPTAYRTDRLLVSVYIKLCRKI